MPQAAVIIPARWESTRFPGKPLHVIAGKPLIRHVWERCREARGIERIVVATDHPRIAETAAAFGAEVAMTSPAHQSGTDRIAEAAAALRGVTHVVNVQGDEPLIDPALITELAETLLAEPDLEMITAANEIDDEADVQNPNVVKVVLDRRSNALYFSRSPVPFARHAGVVPCYRHQGIYGYSTAFLAQFVQWPPGLLERTEGLEQLRALENGARIRVVLTTRRSLGVDAPEDVAAVESQLIR
ncbi:MAG TPA: 3-deoxy-manno-octulosonate cytidylyltransferase [Chthoniobacteraceae bacterium]|jgi:3-deoxy-manno-octulosonate cytidylyltransferase (CMP-KDO synthetase)|nr:3-deoxy-manno-octulosonate cytidylyltransferase [Chthoniobacteraceae bacterium]